MLSSRVLEPDCTKPLAQGPEAQAGCLGGDCPAGKKQYLLDNEPDIKAIKAFPWDSKETSPKDLTYCQ